jgi:hypothetical protein
MQQTQASNPLKQLASPLCSPGSSLEREVCSPIMFVTAGRAQSLSETASKSGQIALLLRCRGCDGCPGTQTPLYQQTTALRAAGVRIPCTAACGFAGTDRSDLHSHDRCWRDVTGAHDVSDGLQGVAGGQAAARAASTRESILTMPRGVYTLLLLCAKQACGALI